MEKWYVLRTIPEKEQQAAELMEHMIDHRLWTYCRILKKIKVFRSGGALHLLEERMFPGYLFIRTNCPAELEKKLKQARRFPQFVGTVDDVLISVEDADLDFLRNVCGEELQYTMGITRVILGKDNQIVRAEGVLSRYLNRIVKLNLRKRFAMVDVKLFNREQTVLFGVCLEQDQAG